MKIGNDKVLLGYGVKKFLFENCYFRKDVNWFKGHVACGSFIVQKMF